MGRGLRCEGADRVDRRLSALGPREDLDPPSSGSTTAPTRGTPRPLRGSAVCPRLRADGVGPQGVEQSSGLLVNGDAVVLGVRHVHATAPGGDPGRAREQAGEGPVVPEAARMHAVRVEALHARAVPVHDEQPPVHPEGDVGGKGQEVRAETQFAGTAASGRAAQPVGRDLPSAAASPRGSHSLLGASSTTSTSRQPSRPTATTLRRARSLT